MSQAEHRVEPQSGPTRSGPAAGSLLRGCGAALLAGGVMLVVATLLHPSVESTSSILEAEKRLVAAHILFTSSFIAVLLGLPGLYAAQSARMGRLGAAGFFASFVGTALLAITGNYGFLAPVLAAQTPETIDAISAYPPVVVVNAVGALTFMVGFVMFGTAMTRIATFPRAAGILVALGAPLHLIGFGLAQFASPVLWPLAVLGSAALGAGLALPGIVLWQGRA